MGWAGLVVVRAGHTLAEHGPGSAWDVLGMGLAMHGSIWTSADLGLQRLPRHALGCSWAGYGQGCACAGVGMGWAVHGLCWP
jgi:hypothetical protein